MIFAIINDSDDKYFGECFNTRQDAECRIKELSVNFGKNTFYAKEFNELDFSCTCEICLKDGNKYFALDNNDKDNIKRCPVCA